ncbi:MAG: phosphatase PAP2 family protein [Methylovirgula sp.]
MDQAITHWINSFAGSNVALDSIMIMASLFGVPLLILVTVLQWWVQRERLRVRHACVAAGLSFLIGLGLNQIILLFIHRVRPYNVGLTHLIISRSGDWSFPSDHATATFAIAAAFLLQGLRRRGFAYLVAALLICLSRVYVGTHYVTDVLGGAATGILAAAAVRMFFWEGTRADKLITGIL